MLGGLQMSKSGVIQFLKQLTLSLEDSPVKMLALQESGGDWIAPDLDYGSSFPVSLAKLDHDGSWLKMYRDYTQLTLEGDSEKFCQTWPRAGMMRNGIAYQRAPLVPHTYAIACSFLPTPSGDFQKTEQLSVESLIRRGDKHAWGNLAEWVAQNIGARLSPTMLEEMMGFPIGWTE
jgi:hypothetical protein